VEFVGRAAAPFAGCVAEPGPVGALFGLVTSQLRSVASLFGFVAPKLGSVGEPFGPIKELFLPVAELIGSFAFVYVLGPDARIPDSTANVLVRRRRAKLRRRNVAEVRRRRKLARIGRRPQLGRALVRWGPPPLTPANPKSESCLRDGRESPVVKGECGPAGSEGFVHEGDRPGDGVGEDLAPGEPGGDGGREEASGAAGRGDVGAGALEAVPGPAVEETVDDGLTLGTTSGDEDGGGAQCLDPTRGDLGLGFALDREPGEGGGFQEVQGHESGGREEVPDDGVDDG